MFFGRGEIPTVSTAAAALMSFAYSARCLLSSFASTAASAGSALRPSTCRQAQWMRVSSSSFGALDRVRRQCPGCFDERWIVEQYQRRARRAGDRSLGRAFLAGGRIEREQKREQVLPLPMRVDRAAELILAGRRRVIALRKIQCRVILGRLIRLRDVPPSLFTSRPLTDERIVANLLGI